ncbi:MAG: aminopeptidase N [Bdellovibrionales bacterium]|nr:aminopeptidase N [Bdellovibrionales bacterium]
MIRLLQLLLPILLPMMFLTSIGCKTASKSQSKNEASSDLTLSEAEARKARLANVSYDLNINLTDPGSTFQGRIDIGFDLLDANQPLRLDFFEGKVSNLRVNDKPVSIDNAKKAYWIELPAAELRVGRNRVQVDYTQAYSSQGQGLHKFIDPQSKDVFLYTQFQTFDANRFMPCFDQPDLRATFAMTVEAPAKWTVVSATMESAIKTMPGGNKLWVFPKTLPIATYLFSLHAGPFKVWKDQYQNIPLRLMVRPSMAKFVKPAEWFKVTKQGMKFFENYFAFKYPFKKYDQLFVPEFNAGAMENVGAVTFSERYIPRGAPTREERMDVYTTLLHEMAHMWFGDVVTMKWWNDLWLNESFASFLATLALYEATEFKEAWQEFFSGEKVWAYWEDGLVTTHPIQAPVNTVKEAFANFDGITYGKGAAVLKQLQAYVTPEGFKKGIQLFIAQHAMKNAELKDFIAALQTQTKRDLNLWSERWLRQSGTDKVTAQWTCEGDRLREISLINTPSEGARFRPQAVNVALFSKSALPILLRAEMNQPHETFKGDWSCPAFIYPNYGDYGYVAVKLDPASLAYLKKNLSQVQDDLLRTMVWDDLWQMVRSTEMPLKDYIEIVNAHFPKEKNRAVLNQIVRTIAPARSESNVTRYWPQTEAAKGSRTDFIVKTEVQFLRRFNEAKSADEQKIWLDNYIVAAQTPQALDHLATWARQEKINPGLPLDLDRRWHMARQLSRYRHPQAAAIVAELSAKDTSDRGVRAGMGAEAIQPDMAVKQKWVTILKEPKPSVSYANARTVMFSLFPEEQSDSKMVFAPDYYEYIKKNGNSENEVFVESIARALAPLNCEAKTSQVFKAFVEKEKDFAPSISRELKVRLQEDERCQKIRAASGL